MAKDDVSPKDIFRLANGDSREGEGCEILYSGL
jgi:hypothetical protein